MTFDQLLASPWTVEPFDGKWYGTTVRLPNGATITVWISNEFKEASSREIAKGWDHALDGFDHVEQKEDLQVAQLIAAAPALLEYVKKSIDDDFDHLCESDCHICKARTALQSITG